MLSFQGAFPDLADPPARFTKRLVGCGVAHFVGRDLRHPKIGSGLWLLEKVAIVTVPETAVDEDDRMVAREHDVGFAR